MKIINIKKLIASTLIFLFSIYISPALADTPKAHVGIPQLLRGEKSYLMYPCKADFPVPALFSATFQFHKSVLSFTADSFAKSSIVYAWKGETVDKSLTQLLQHPKAIQKVFGIDPAIISSPDGLSQLILLPGWDAFASDRTFLFLSALFMSAFAAFSSCKTMAGKNEPVCIHTKGWIVRMPFISRVIQLLAAHLSQIDGLIVPEEEKTHWQGVQAHLQKREGQSVQQILRDLSSN